MFKLISFLLMILINYCSGIELNLDFLNYKTIDVIRQIYWSSIELFPDENNRTNYRNVDIFQLKKSALIENISKIINILLNQTNYEQNTLLEIVKENKIFKIEKEADINKLISNEEIPKQFLINFALNMDKYSRTENQEINGALDYLNYLTRNDIRDYLIDKFNEFPDLKSPDNFKRYILNDINFNYGDIDGYIKSKSKKELIQLIYGFEKTCFSVDDEDINSCTIPYQMYNHDILDSYNEDDLQIYCSAYKRKLDLNNLEEFIIKIENRGFSYINAKQIFKSDTKTKSIENVKAFETYYKRRNKMNESLSKRDEYLQKLNNTQLKEILEWAVDLFPELSEKARFKDILSSQTNLQYGQVKDFLKISERYQLLKYAYNIHTYQHNITSKYETHLIDFIRLNENKLYDQISIDTNNNILLQEKSSFEHYASLYAHDIKEYLKSLQRNQLIFMAKKIVIIYLKEKTSDKKFLSSKKNLFESIDNMNKKDILNISYKYIDELKIHNIYNLLYKEKDYIIDEVKTFFFYFYNIMDFFRSTDINYLRLWVRKYEIEIRKLKSERYLAGGFKSNFMNFAQYSKDELLEIFDIYVHEYPELFYPENFIRISGLDGGITPHKFLVENQNDTELIDNITFSITAYMQTKNLQINFDYDEFLSILIFKQEEDEVDKEYIKHNLIYSIFRIINIFPELNNMVLFRRICLDETTKFLYREQFEDYFNTKRDIKKIAENIGFYYKVTNFDGLSINEKITKDNSEETNIQFIKNFMNKPFKTAVKYRVLTGDFHSLLYNFSFYLKDQSNISINNAYYELYNKKYVLPILRNKELQIEEICKAINNNKELQNVSYFDSKFNYINIHSEQYEEVEDLYNYLNEKIDNRQLFYYCLIANLIKIDYEEEASSIKEIPDIYLNIHYMSRIAMIRYILNVAKFNDILKNRLSPENLRKLNKKYFLDIGSDNVYDLTMF